MKSTWQQAVGLMDGSPLGIDDGIEDGLEL